MLHFVIAVARDRALPAELVAALDSPSAPIHEPTTGHASRSEPGIAVGLWSDDGSPWMVDDRGLVAIVGLPTDRARSRDELLAQLAADGPTPCRDYDGMFTAIGVRDGEGWIRSDRFGLSPVYRAERDGVTLLSNRPGMIAALLAVVSGAMPKRDLSTAIDVAVLGTASGDASGYEGIERVPDRHDVDFDTAGVRSVETWPFFWDDEIRTAGGDVDAIVTRVADRLVAATAAWVRHAPGVVEAELTGGRDSRLVLALVRLAGVDDRVSFHTFGPPEAPDARAAQHLSALYGFSWEMRRARVHELSREGFLRRVAAVSGEFGTDWVDPPQRGTILFSGLMGEALSVKYRGSKPKTLERAQARLARLITRRQPFVRESAVRRVTDKLGGMLATIVDEGCEPIEVLDAFYLRERERRWIGSRPTCWDRKVFPLYSPTAIVSNLALPVDERHAARIHTEITASAGMTSEIFGEGLPPAPPLPPVPDLSGLRWPRTLAEIAHECVDSPLRDHIDVDAVIAATQRWHDLDRVTTQKLTDALTALTWSLPDLCPDPAAG